MTTPLVSVLILTKNAGPEFASTLQNLFAAKGINEAEVLVVDSGSLDCTLEIVASYPRVRLHRTEANEFGHGKTRNLAASMATGEFLLFLVQDAVPVGVDFLLELLQPFAESQTAAVYGRQCPRETADPIEKLFMTSVYGNLEVVKTAGDPSRMKMSTIFFSNVFSAIRRSVWREIPFDEGMIMSEDQKWARDVMVAGHSVVYRPTACVMHSHHYTWAELFQRNFDSGYSLIGVVDDTKLGMLKDQCRFLRTGLKFLYAEKALWWSGRFLLFQAVRILGFACGQTGRVLPIRLRRSLSMHKYHWD